jgi:hypothetical protein
MDMVMDCEMMPSWIWNTLEGKFEQEMSQRMWTMVRTSTQNSDKKRQIGNYFGALIWDSNRTAVMDCRLRWGHKMTTILFAKRSRMGVMILTRGRGRFYNAQCSHVLYWKNMPTWQCGMVLIRNGNHRRNKLMTSIITATLWKTVAITWQGGAQS